ncbi:MAG TPA: hypothetical protein VGB37_02840, partial [Candidatus Lokiarchaeia archaeon]
FTHFGNRYRKSCPIIGKRLLECNDIMQFDRLLAELFLFVYLYKIHNANVKVLEQSNKSRTPDFSIQFNSRELLLELFTPTDFYSFQLFKRKITQILKYLRIDIGYDLKVYSIADSSFYANEFPEFIKIIPWFYDFEKRISSWLVMASKNDEMIIDSPISSLKIKVIINNLFHDRVRQIIWSHSTQSTDTISFFRINDPEQFSLTEWGIKIKDKLNCQQAGPQDPRNIRLFLLNLSNSDTNDLSFLNVQKYKDNISKDIKFLAADILPFPPYDIVLPCAIGFECGFSIPVKLSQDKAIIVDEIINFLGFNLPVKEKPSATEEDTKKLISELFELNDH